MRAVVQSKAGEPINALMVVDIPEPRALGDGEILVRVLATPIHHGDLFMTRLGKDWTNSTSNDEALPRGSEAVGVVSSIGPNVPIRPGLHVGARVAIFPAFGAWREKIAVHHTSAVVIPDSMSDGVASLMLVNGITASLIIREVRANLPSNTLDIPVILQTGAASAVAKLVTALARWNAIPMISLVRRKASAQELNRLFPDVPVVVTDKVDWQQEVRARALEHPIGVAVDCIGGALTGDLVDLLCDAGTVVVYGGLAEGPLNVTALQITSREIGLRGVSIGRWHHTTSPETRQRDIENALSLATSHPKLFEIAAEYPPDQLVDALEHAERPAKNGSVLLRFSHA